MIHSEKLELPHHVYPTDEWRLVEKRFYPRLLPQTETFFSVGNGYLGMRGTFEEGKPLYESGTFVNGFFESWPIVYGEEAFGYAKTGQTIVNVPDATLIRLTVDDEPFKLTSAELLLFERALNMREGTLDREILWETSTGKRVSIKSRRLVSFRQRHLAAIAYEVTVPDDEASLVLSSEVRVQRHVQDDDDDPRGGRAFEKRVLLPRVHQAEEGRVVLGFETENSGMTLACGIDHLLETECAHSSDVECAKESGKVVFSVAARPGVPIRLVKFMTYHTSRSAQPKELCERAERTLDRAVKAGFDETIGEQRAFMDDFWRRSDVEFRGDPAVQQVIRFNLFHILQASARSEGTGIPAKGLTGPGYEGHYFWDIETYLLPFLTYTAPRVARNILRFRYLMLDKARERARQVNQKGALFPWRTINGDEASAYYAAGTAQYHINADIMYALRRYVEVTGDEDFHRRFGAEMLVETARLWMDLGFFSERKGGRFCIQGVTGPDEYNTVVNNNAFTNLMARENLWYAVETVEDLKERHPEHYEALVHKTGLEEDEIGEWKRAADRMYLPDAEGTDILPQDDSFLDKEPWDFAHTPEDKYPLLLHYHPLVIYRHRVIKQADVVLALFLLGHEFSREEKRRNFDFYDPLTTGDSSLSASIQSILAFELDYVEKAHEYARCAALMDLANIGGNVRDGCHMASMGGTWMAAVYGIAGMRDTGGELSFRPRLFSKKLKGMRFTLTVRGRLLEVDIGPEVVIYSLKEGGELTIRHEGEEVRLTPEAPRAERPHAKLEDLKK